MAAPGGRATRWAGVGVDDAGGENLWAGVGVDDLLDAVVDCAGTGWRAPDPTGTSNNFWWRRSTAAGLWTG